MEERNYQFAVGSQVAADDYSAELRCKGLEELDLFVDVVNPGAWAGVTQLDVYLETSVDRNTWTRVKSGEADVSLSFTEDGLAYATVDPVPGRYLRLAYGVTGTGDTLTVTAVGVGRG